MAVTKLLNCHKINHFNVNIRRMYLRLVKDLLFWYTAASQFHDLITKTGLRHVKQLLCFRFSHWHQQDQRRVHLSCCTMTFIYQEAMENDFRSKINIIYMYIQILHSFYILFILKNLKSGTHSFIKTLQILSFSHLAAVGPRTLENPWIIDPQATSSPIFTK